MAERREWRGHQYLSPRERKVLALCALGYSLPDTAEELSVGVQTAKTFMKKAKFRLDAHTQAQAVASWLLDDPKGARETIQRRGDPPPPAPTESGEGLPLLEDVLAGLASKHQVSLDEREGFNRDRTDFHLSRSVASSLMSDVVALRSDRPAVSRARRRNGLKGARNG